MVFVFNCKSQYMANHFRDHPSFIRANNPDDDWAGLRGNDHFIGRVSLLFDFNSNKFHSIVNPRANDGGVLSNPTREDQRVQSSERRGETNNPLFYPVAKKCDRLCSVHIVLLLPEQFLHAGADFRDAEQPRL